MEKTKSVRSIDGLGRVILPHEIRGALGWGDKTFVEIWLNEEKEVIIRQHVFSCACCGATENLREFHKKHICADCQKEISRL